MTSTITLTAALRSNLLSLQGTQTLLDSTQFRLATGRKVNSALDNPNSYFTSQALTNRANDLNALLDGQGQAIQALKAADQGITSLTTLVQQAQSIAKAAQDSVSSTALARSGDIAATVVANLTGGTGATLVNNDTLLLSNNSSVSTSTITISTGETLAQLASAINALSGFSATIVDGSGTGTTAAQNVGAKRLDIRATNGGTLKLAGTATAKLQAVEGVTAGATGYTGDTGLTIVGATIAVSSNTVDQISLQNQFDAIRTQIDQLIQDTGYRGTNLLNGDSLVTQFNEKNTSKQTVTGVTFNSTGLSIAATNNTVAASQGFFTATSIQTSLDSITSALTTLRSQAQSFGNNLSVIQTRQDFTKNLVNLLKEGSDKLTLADKNEEGANLLSLQTSQQLGIQALALASQANQSVLRLFG